MMSTKNSGLSFRSILLCLIYFFSSNLSAQEILDGDNESPTQRSGMHACPPGLFVKGLDAHRNILLCGPPPSFGRTLGNEFIDGDNEPPTQYTIGRTKMHKCPPKSAITGINVVRNEFLCQRYLPTSSSLSEQLLHNKPTKEIIHYPAWCQIPILCEWLATKEIFPNERKGVRACGEDEVVVGIHIEQSEFICGIIIKTVDFEDN
ncbi:hypothetical protein SAMN05216326_105122 [Nitrosomonas marina]|uniref:EndoU nuclease n=1 Tax=Nitrosomonas marina TaxID=917 RepID=A0A1H9ZZ10_9PROT|nr:hypothetical protein [Nitrosomonas marina]SES87009.1 hypothetical protein SAMN05216326_105122 [Nitrosomonas marina]